MCDPTRKARFAAIEERIAAAIRSILRERIEILNGDPDDPARVSTEPLLAIIEHDLQTALSHMTIVRKHCK